MQLSELTHQYAPQPNRDSVYVVLHGISEGISSDFIQNIYKNLVDRGEAVLAFNWPFLDVGIEPSKDLVDEQAALQSAADFLWGEGYSQLRIVAKSLGGIVTSRWLQQAPADLSVEVGILGYVIGDVATASVADKLKVVVQGERDRFGSAKAVERELERGNSTATVIEIADADHSYRNQAGEPAYQQQAIEQLLQRL
ncbi:MAG TPA: alpha/beta family hydrolase [Candidatus Saccharimonadales bacterium]|nr:alpha/beta family hydrolase [Candidatus Saccharimonadales bacterium]